MMIKQLSLIMVILLSSVTPSVFAQSRKTKNVVIVMTDGFRWQDLFRGPDASMLTKVGDANPKADALRKRYLIGTAEENRAGLMPFIWNTIAKQGQIFGNRDVGSSVVVTNGFNFSYPGYNETLTGRPNPEVNSNDYPDNPRASVLEWLNTLPKYRGNVAAFTMWRNFDHILRRDKAGFPVVVAFEPLQFSPMTEQLTELNELKASLPHIFGDEEAIDAPVFYQALTYLKREHPRVLFISLGETDLWAHQGKYPDYLEAARHYDGFLRKLWETLQFIPQYRDSTTLVLATDHGRGEGTKWVVHGADYTGSENIWTAYLGPDTPTLGMREKTPQLTQGQLAATVAALLGEDFRITDSGIAPPISDVLPK